MFWTHGMITNWPKRLSELRCGLEVCWSGRWGWRQGDGSWNVGLFIFFGWAPSLWSYLVGNMTDMTVWVVTIGHHRTIGWNGVAKFFDNIIFHDGSWTMASPYLAAGFLFWTPLLGLNQRFTTELWYTLDGCHKASPKSPLDGLYKPSPVMVGVWQGLLLYFGLSL
jgi:hypothetical protein